MANVTVTKDRYTVDSLYQWSKDQDLIITGLSLASIPEIHFTNDAMDKAIVRQATMDEAGVITARIPNSLLQKPYKIRAYVCIYEGESFRSLYLITIPIEARSMPNDYTLTVSDDEVYSFNTLENLVNNTVRTLTLDNSNLREELTKKCNETVNSVKESNQTLETNLTKKYEDTKKAVEESNEQLQTELNQKYEDTVEELNAKYDSSVRQAENSIEDTTAELSARLDNVIAHNNDTNGNTELIDLRTGVDGTVHGSAGEAVRSQINKFKNFYKITQVDEKLKFDNVGFIRSNGNFWLLEGYYYSNPVKVFEGQTLYIWQSMNADALYLIAYDENFNIDMDNSLSGIYTANAQYTYVVPSGVSYIAICCQKTWVDVCMITSKPNAIQNIAYYDLLFSGDLSSIEWLSGAYYFGSDKRYLLGNTGVGSINTRLPIPCRFLKKIYFTNTEYTAEIYFFDAELNYLCSSGILNTIFSFRNIPANAEYMHIRITKSGADIQSIDEVGLELVFDISAWQEASKRELSDTYDSWDKNALKQATVISEWDKELMAHTSNVYYGGDGYLYIPYYASHNSTSEGIQVDTISKMVKIPVCDLSKGTVTYFAEKGCTIGDFQQSEDFSPYDALLIETDNPDVYRIAFIATPTGGNPTVAVREFTKSTMAFNESVTLANFKYTIDGVTHTVPMDVPNLSIFIDRLLGRTEGTSTIGVYPIVTRAVEYNGEWYSYLGGLQSQADTTGFGGCIIKTSDHGETWEFVAYNEDLSYVVCMWEGALEILDGKAICLLRAVCHGEPYDNNSYYQHALIMSYDLNEKTWSEVKLLCGTDPYTSEFVDEHYAYTNHHEEMIYTDPSRPFLYVRDGYVYAFNNVNPLLKTRLKPDGDYRSHMRIYKYDTDLNLIGKKSILNNGGVHYMSCVDALGEEYFCFTEDRKHLGKDNKGNIALMRMDFLDF